MVAGTVRGKRASGKIICVAMPQKFQVEKSRVFTLNLRNRLIYRADDEGDVQLPFKHYI
jgi:hypothetical protein